MQPLPSSFLILFLVALSLLSPAVSSSSSKISGGTPVSPRFKYEWMASLNVVTKNSSFHCGGSLVAPGWILTSARCSIGAIPEKCQVNLHRYNLDLDPDWEAGFQLTPESIVIHPDYSQNHESDMALWKLFESDHVKSLKPIVLDQWYPTYLTAGVVVQMLGWGETESGTASSIILSTDMTMAASHPCFIKYPSFLDSYHYCAESPSFGGPCSGDEGGPVITNATFGFVQIGLITNKTTCGGDTGARYFTRVESVWVSKEMESYSHARLLLPSRLQRGFGAFVMIGVLFVL